MWIRDEGTRATTRSKSSPLKPVIIICLVGASVYLSHSYKSAWLAGVNEKKKADETLREKKREIGHCREILRQRSPWISQLEREKTKLEDAKLSLQKKIFVLEGETANKLALESSKGHLHSDVIALTETTDALKSQLDTTNQRITELESEKAALQNTLNDLHEKLSALGVDKSEVKRDTFRHNVPGDSGGAASPVSTAESELPSATAARGSPKTEDEALAALENSSKAELPVSAAAEDSQENSDSEESLRRNQSQKVEGNDLEEGKAPSELQSPVTVEARESPKTEASASVAEESSEPKSLSPLKIESPFQGTLENSLKEETNVSASGSSLKSESSREVSDVPKETSKERSLAPALAEKSSNGEAATSASKEESDKKKLTSPVPEEESSEVNGSLPEAEEKTNVSLANPDEAKCLVNESHCQNETSLSPEEEPPASDNHVENSTGNDSLSQGDANEPQEKETPIEAKQSGGEESPGDKSGDGESPRKGKAIESDDEESTSKAKEPNEESSSKEGEQESKEDDPPSESKARESNGESSSKEAVQETKENDSASEGKARVPDEESPSKEGVQDSKEDDSPRESKTKESKEDDSPSESKAKESDEESPNKEVQESKEDDSPSESKAKESDKGSQSKNGVQESKEDDSAHEDGKDKSS